MGTGATSKTLTKLVVDFADLGITDRDDRLWFCGQHVGRELTTSAELSAHEAHTLIERLAKANPAAMAAVLASRRQPVPAGVTGSTPIPASPAPASRDTEEPERYQPRHTDVIVCGADGPLTDDQRRALDDLIDDVTAEADARAALSPLTEPSPAEETSPDPGTLTPTSGMCTCVLGGTPGTPSPCDPQGVGRYCPPRVCYCGNCPWWKADPPPNYREAIASLYEKEQQRLTRRNR